MKVSIRRGKREATVVKYWLPLLDVPYNLKPPTHGEVFISYNVGIKNISMDL